MEEELSPSFKDIKMEEEPSPSFKVQLYSDFHLESIIKHKLPLPEIPVRTNYLILCGDIGSPQTNGYSAFIQEQASKFKKVFIITGNNEYKIRRNQIIKSLSETDQIIQEICNQSGKNVIFLQNSVYDLEETNYRLIGTIFWGAFAKENEEEENMYIQNPQNKEVKSMLCQDQVEQNLQQTTWIKNQIEIAYKLGKKVIMITHYPPTKRNTHACNLKNFTDMEDFLGTEIGKTVKIWMHGHTHFSTDQIIHNTRIVSNQCGRPLKKEHTHFDIYRVIDLEEPFEKIEKARRGWYERSWLEDQQQGIQKVFECKHFDYSALNIQQFFEIKEIIFGNQCEICKSQEDNYICLHCKKILCSRKIKSHQASHSRKLKHPLSMSLNLLNFWCNCKKYFCSFYAKNQELDKFQKEMEEMKKEYEKLNKVTNNN